MEMPECRMKNLMGQETCNLAGVEGLDELWVVLDDDAVSASGRDRCVLDTWHLQQQGCKERMVDNDGGCSVCYKLGCFGHNVVILRLGLADFDEQTV